MRATVFAALALLSVGGCASTRPPEAEPTSTSSSRAAVESSAGADDEDAMMRVRFTIGGQEATATLADNPTARDFASLLPVTVRMHDLFGREKPGPLPRALDEGAEHVFTYEIGDVSYWPPDHDIAIFYADDGSRSIPNPGLIPLATVDTGLDLIARAGDDFEMTIEMIP